MLDSRAVLRPVYAGNEGRCAHCVERIKFNTKNRRQLQAICNIYKEGRWERVDHYHADCYVTAGEPYGKAAL